MKSEQKRINDRFIKVMHECIANKEFKCKDKRAFAAKLKMQPSGITHISNYIQGVSSSLLIELYKVFGVSPNYILLNIGMPKLSQPQKNTLEDLVKRVQVLESKISSSPAKAK